MKLTFYKYQGTGNDFVIIDNRQGMYNLSTKQVNFLCDRRFGVGADGLMLLNTKEGYDFEMKYFNADGKEGSMCGNGGRCLVKFAWDQDIRKEVYSFIAYDGPHQALFDSNHWVKLKMQDVNHTEKYNGDTLVDTGSPHYVQIVNNVMKHPVVTAGRHIRTSERFNAAGINVNFVEVTPERILVRTYERGVEDETLSCGTGVTASSLVCATASGYNRVEVTTPGGELAVEFDKVNENTYRDIWLSGPTVFVYRGEIEVEE